MALTFLVLGLGYLIGKTQIRGLELGSVTGVLFAILAATGALLSGENPMPTPVRLAHRIVPYLCLGSSAVTHYLLLSS